MDASQRSIILEHRDFYHHQLRQVLSFWEQYGFDEESGGFFTCLDQDGRKFDDFKSVWAQGRALYIFATAYREVEKKESWLRMAYRTYDFIKNHCIDDDGDMFFIVTHDGKGVQKRRYWYSESFACIGSAALYRVTGNIDHLNFAQSRYTTISDYYFGRKQKTPKYNPESVDLNALAPSMILLNTIQILEQADPLNAKRYADEKHKVIESIISLNYHPDKKALLENVLKDGTFSDTPKGRVVNPGHALEAAWFLLDESDNNPELQTISETIVEWSFDFGWDDVHGGILYFVDVNNRPLEQLEWDMKLWWPHCEALIALLKLWAINDNESVFKRYLDVFDYTKHHFIIDDKEWIGYLHRDNTPSTTLKGNLFKGPYHIPRMLMTNYLLCNRILNQDSEDPSSHLRCLSLGSSGILR